MSQPETTLAIPVAGVGNLHIGPVSTADAHFTHLTHSLEHAGMTVASPVIPHGLGILQSLQKTYRQTRANILATAAKYPHHDKIVLFTHSLGGLLAKEFLGDEQDERFVGMVALSGPFGALTQYKHIPGAAHIAEDIAKLATEGTRLMPTAEGGPQVAQIGLRGDFVVSPMAALTPIHHAEPNLHLLTNPLLEEAARHLSDYDGLADDPNVTVHQYYGVPDHNLMLFAPAFHGLGMHIESPVSLATRLGREMATAPRVTLEAPAAINHLTMQFGSLPLAQA